MHTKTKHPTASSKYRFLLFLGLLSSAFTPIAQAADELIVFSGRSDKFVKPVVKAFTDKTGIKVTLHSGKSTALLNKLNLEGDKTQADLFLSNDAGTLQKGSELGLFAPVSAEIAKQIPASYKATDNSWLGLSARARVLVVNVNSKLAAQAKSVFDLADPKFKGKLAITNSTNESYIAGATVYMLSQGKDKTKNWLEGMKSNVQGKVFNKHSKIVKAVATGKKDIGLVNHYYIFRHLAKEPKAAVKLVLPDQENGMGIAWNVAGIAVSKHSKKQKSVEAFLNFLVSEQGQKLFAEVNREYPTRTGVAASAEVPPLSSYKVADVPMYKLGQHRNETIDLIEAVGMP